MAGHLTNSSKFVIQNETMDQLNEAKKSLINEENTYLSRPAAKSQDASNLAKVIWQLRLTRNKNVSYPPTAKTLWPS
jgi:hypothetical protein